jgi:hypothetical protein
MQCPHCINEHPEGTKFCPLTGEEILIPDLCPECGKPIEPIWLHCIYCGQSLIQPEGISDQQEAQAAGEPQTPIGMYGLLKTRIAPIKGFWLLISAGSCGLLLVAVVLIAVLMGVNYKETPSASTSGLAATVQVPNHIADLVAEGLITVNISGVGIDALALHIQNNTANPQQINIPAGTYFVAMDPSTQNMVVRHSNSTLIQPHSGVDITLDAACANLHRNEPSNKDTFSILPTSEQPELTKVIDTLNSSKADYAIEQAAIWILTDNATFDELGMLVRDSRFGPPLIKENEAVRAMMLIDEAGVDILKYAIWGDREQLVLNVTDPELVAWLNERSGTMPAQTTPVQGDDEISQFAKEASASSQYSSPGWSAIQAAGAPNSAGCGDFSSAWASLQSKGKDWLLLSYDQPVIPTRIVIYQSFQPGAVALVEVVDEAGKSFTVYEADPTIDSICPSMLEIEVKDVNNLVRSIRITIDQSNHNGWNEIDAVQLFGVSR